MEDNFNTQPSEQEFEAAEAENNREEAESEPTVARGFVPTGFTQETYLEKKSIRRTAATVGVPAICIYLISAVWSTVYFFITDSLGISVNEAMQFANNPAIQQLLQVIISTLMFTVPFVVAVKLAGMNVGEVADFSAPEKGTALPFFMFGLGFCAFANIAVSYAGSLFDGFGIDYSVDFGENPRGFLGFVLSLIATAVVPALVEEFACRGIILGLLKKYGEGFAIITSSIIFGVMHGNFEQIPFAFLVGLILGFIYVKTKSIWVCVAVHAANNLVSVLFSYAMLGDNALNLIYTLYLLACMLLAVVGVLMLSQKGTEVYILQKSQTACSEAHKYKWFFTSVFIIIFIVINLIEAMAYFVK